MKRCSQCHETYAGADDFWRKAGRPLLAAAAPAWAKAVRRAFAKNPDHRRRRAAEAATDTGASSSH